MAPSPPHSDASPLPCYTREEVAQHKKYKDCWIILHGEVYNVTEWLAKHPGGGTVLFHYAGQDASVRTHTRKERSTGNRSCIVCVWARIMLGAPSSNETTMLQENR